MPLRVDVRDEVTCKSCGETGKEELSFIQHCPIVLECSCGEVIEVSCGSIDCVMCSTKEDEDEGESGTAQGNRKRYRNFQGEADVDTY